MGIPGCHISDGAPAFTSHELEAFLNAYDTEQMITHPNHPQSHGIVERVNKETKKHLMVLLNELPELAYEDWTEAIPMVEYRLNSAEHSSTGYAPCTLIYGTQSVEELQLMSKTALKSTNDFDRYLKELDYNFKVLRDASVKHQDYAALERYEKSVQKEPEPLSIGKYALKSQHSPPFQEKLRMKYTGQYRVTQKLRPDFYEILDLVQDQTENVHRMELLPINCDDDDMARREHAKDAKELFISEVLDHEGEPQKRSTVKFRCMVRGHSKPFIFNFVDCKYIPAIREYVEKNTSLHYLKPLMVDLNTEKRRTKGKYSKTSSVYTSKF